jgi:hypothetical protein
MNAEETSARIEEVPPPEGNERGWYPDPLGSTAERYWDRSWLDLTRVPKTKLASRLPSQSATSRRRRAFRFPLSFVAGRAGLSEANGGPLGKGRTPQRYQQKQMLEVEARKRAFFESPAGRARLSFGQKHRVFQFELDLGRPETIVIPGVDGTAPLATSDPVDILNSVVAEGWKLVAGSFEYADTRGGAVGFYLFKRSKKRLREMNDPWRVSGS